MSCSLHIKDKSENSRFLKAAPFRKNTRKTEPHKHNSYFEIVYLSGGKGSHTVDNRSYEVRPPVLFFVRQEQVHHWDLDADMEPDGYVLIVKKTFFEKSLDGELKQFLGKMSRLTCAYLEDDATVRQLFELLVRESVVDDPTAFSIMEALMKGLFGKILQVAKPVEEKNRRRRELYESFIDLLVQDQFHKNTVAYYAGLLNTTPQNLNATCRKASGLSAAEVLAGYVVDEAKRLLAYSDHTVTEIAFELAFKDPSHFVKYFKQHTTFTPQAFRFLPQSSAVKQGNLK
jgi:AraC-like DNA-binding protein